MTDFEIRKLAKAIIVEALENDALLKKIASMVQSTTKAPVRLVTAREAASMLGISVGHLRSIKDDENGMPRFSYVKTGSGKNCALKFNANTLVSEYERYIGN